MPKKRTGKALLIKPGSQAAIASASSHPQNEAIRPSVNDLIRESRRAHLRDQLVPASQSQPLPSSVPPQVRDVLNLPTPVAPQPRPGVRRVRPTPIPHSDRGPSRVRTVPGPPPPKSWLIDSRHAPAAPSQDEYQSIRQLDNPIPLPGAYFPPAGSLLHHVLKEMAVNWEWHVSYDGMYLQEIPNKLREALLSYVATYNDHVASNPLRMLFLASANPAEGVKSEVDELNGKYNEVTRLDLSRGIGVWTRLRQLEKDLVSSPSVSADAVKENPAQGVPESWDSEQSLPLPPLRTGLIVPNLKHLSLSVNSSSTASSGNPISWKLLVQLCTHLPTLESLSLAHWPQPTYTPVAAQTHARVTVTPGSGSSPRINFGGTTMYSRLDNDFRESAGILRSLSQKLHSLIWLDLTGCGEWWDALYWQPRADWSAESEPEFSEGEQEHHVPDTLPAIPADPQSLRQNAARSHGPDWNGVWRSVAHIGLKIGYMPIEPEGVDNLNGDPAAVPEWDRFYGSQVRKRSLWLKEKHAWDELKQRQDEVVRRLRWIRRREGGKWIEFEV